MINRWFVFRCNIDTGSDGMGPPQVAWLDTFTPCETLQAACRAARKAFTGEYCDLAIILYVDFDRRLLMHGMIGWLPGKDFADIPDSCGNVALLIARFAREIVKLEHVDLKVEVP